MILLFLVPLAALIAVSVLYHAYLGFKTIGIYALLWVVCLFAIGFFKLPPIMFVAIQALLAIALYLQARMRSTI
jgi:hypothetical protein